MSVVVRTVAGSVRGAVGRCGVLLFAGIPYAAPPIGPLRFAAPRPAAPWPDVRNATRFAQPSLQAAAGGDIIGSEDCLYLNIQAPAEPGPHPVLVWIHGGGAVAGSSQSCDGTRFAEHGVVVVTVGYRLGILGLLYLPGVFGEDVSGNFAILDIVAALRWVRDNISAFGGDPGRVTVAGSSNGGRVVGTLLAMPCATGLFQQAVVQSGTGVGFVVDRPDQASHVTDTVLAELGLDHANAAVLREIPATHITQAQQRLTATWPSHVPYRAVIDGVSLPCRPIDAVRAGAARRARLLVGSNHDEQDLGLIPSMMIDQATLEQSIVSYQTLSPDLTDDELHRHVVTSSDWWLPAIRLAEAQATAGGDVWMYRLDWRITRPGRGPGAPHGLDVPLVFDDLSHNDWATVLHQYGCPDVRSHDMAATMHAAWTRFITSGNPGWSPYTPESRATILLNDTSTMIEDPDCQFRLVWQDIV